MGKDLNLDEILGEYSGKAKKSSKIDLDDLDISFKSDDILPKTEKNTDSDEKVNKLLGFTDDVSSASDEEIQENDKDQQTVENVHTSNESKAENNNADDLKLHFGRTGEMLVSDPEDKNTDKVDEPKIRPTNKNSKTDNSSKAPAKKKKNKGKKKSRFNGSIFGGIIIVTIILTVSMVLAVGGITIGMEYYGIGKTDNDISFNIPEGSTNDEIADLMVENGVIKNKKLFLLAIKIQKPATIYPGDITLQPSLGYSAIISRLSVMRESYDSVTITFTEGENLLDIANKLEENGVCAADDFIFEFNKNQGFDFESNITEKERENSFYAMEGYFFPDTYDFYVGDTASNVTRVVREHFESKLTDKMFTRMDKLGLDINQTMTLASIVQLEAENTDEMPKVASVFLNRLNDPDTFPMLQSDTTTKYIENVISKQSDNQSTIEHYTDYYDTYHCKGLPAGPICNPGLDAIMAVLYPEETDYYYFCNNLETGETFYAKTLEEHEENLVKAGLAEEKD